MKLVIQRVTSASVTVGENVVGRIGKGLCVLVGIAHNDTPTDMEYAIRKILKVRLFSDCTTGKHWTKNVTEIDGEVLLVSQFTLCHVLKGNKPDFHNAMTTKEAQQFFDNLTIELRAAYQTQRISTGQFGAYMDVQISNDGPVTLFLNSQERELDKAKD